MSYFFLKGNELKLNNKEGVLVIKRPWPSMAMTIFGDHQRFIETYLKPYKGSFPLSIFKICLIFKISK